MGRHPRPGRRDRQPHESRPTRSLDKLEEYFKAGVRQVWVVYPRHSKVYAYTSTTAIRMLAPGDELDGGDVLPGFHLSVTDLFNNVGEPA